MAAVILAVIVLIIKIFLPCCCSFVVCALLPSFVEHLSRPPVPGAGHGKDSNITLSSRCTLSKRLKNCMSNCKRQKAKCLGHKIQGDKDQTTPLRK